MQKQFYVDTVTESSCFEGRITGDGRSIWTVTVDPHHQQWAQFSLLGSSSRERRERRELGGILASLSEKIQQEAEEHEAASGELSGTNLESVVSKCKLQIGALESGTVASLGPGQEPLALIQALNENFDGDVPSNLQQPWMLMLMDAEFHRKVVPEFL